MRCSMTTLVLATLAIGQAAAATIGGIHKGHHNHAARHTEVKRAESSRRKRGTFLADDDQDFVKKMGFKDVGKNSFAPTPDVWIGDDGPYTNEFSNQAGQSLILVVWGPWASWVNDKVPLVTLTLPAGANTTLSFADGVTGAWSAIYNDTQLVNGQISNTWGEFTFGKWGVVDVSREVNMKGHSMSITGPTCVSDMDTCVFVCASGDVCKDGYILKNCENGSQPGANYGIFDDGKGGVPSGGCGGMGSSAKLQTVLS